MSPTTAGWRPTSERVCGLWVDSWVSEEEVTAKRGAWLPEQIRLDRQRGIEVVACPGFPPGLVTEGLQSMNSTVLR